ncbi:quaternary ammonium compound-resistance protein SugE [Psychrobacillus sp. OK028]|uniref:quaternary ammonium compound efflux SMR transporter SugE n=1 Tax=Psychrobacillus sp. OK028 TaxID=1884359 RepID=UPI000890AE71|nr:quaternary ammonium compound efflux SMR transporter SugE [Psychrobacillus sp. OK028]SDN39255.1 quaternary ammonium compound-resistance protein SugE [Psychrobacillus sp. OK028]
MAWILLIIAGLTEIVWAIGLKEAHGFTELVPSIITIVFLIVSFFLFAQAMKTIPIGTAYAIFTGIGAAGTAIVGIFWFEESVSVGKVFFLLVLLFGIIGLKLVDDEEEANS